MKCPRCPKDMHTDDSSGTVAWACWCGHIEYPRLETNALCDQCMEFFVKKGRAKICPDWKASNKLKKLPVQACEHCSDEYIPRRRGTRFCSESCQTKAAWRRKKAVKHCELCGDPIEGSGSKFCSEECRTIKWKTENADKIKAASKKSYEKNIDEQNARGRQRYADKRELRLEQGKKWDKANRDKRLKYSRDYRERHPERARALDRASYKRRKEARQSA